MLAGFQVPDIPLSEIEGRAGTLAPAQTERAVPKENVGIVFGLTVTFSVKTVAHCPGSGVNV